MNNKQVTQADWQIKRDRRIIMTKFGVTFLAVALVTLYLLPFVYGVLSSVKTRTQMSDPNGSLLPRSTELYEYRGDELSPDVLESESLKVKKGDMMEIFANPLGDGRNMVALKKTRSKVVFFDPENIASGVTSWEGNWRTGLTPVNKLDFAWENYKQAYDTLNFPRLLFNTLSYALISMVGAVVSAAFVAYGFARHNFPYKNILFAILLSTIILPSQVTLIPQYAFFSRIGWVGSYLPLIVPQFFSNAYNVFLLRQYFMTIPPEMEEAAKIDGAGPLRSFFYVILPQAVPPIVAVCLFHFFFAWNDFFGPLVYLSGRKEMVPFSVGMTFFSTLFDTPPNLIQAAAVLTLIIPLIIFFFAQRVFVQGIVVTGDK